MRKIISVIILVIACVSYISASAQQKNSIMNLTNNSAISSDVKDNSQRIVVLEFGLLDELVLLGVKPIGVATSGAMYEGSDPEYLEPVIQASQHVGARDAPNLEEIIKLKPTLIIADKDFNGVINQQLQKIAPTIM